MANQDEVLVKFRADANEVLSEVNKIESSVKKMSNTVDASQKAINRSTQKTAYGFNGLGNSINQLSRELPAFTYSAQTGFLALSNNIPILADQITNLKTKNLELVASGQKAIPVWKSVASAIFSWQTALSLGVTLLTVYGGQLISWIGSMLSAEKQTERNKWMQDQYNKVLKESNELIALNNELVNRSNVTGLATQKQTQNLRSETQKQLEVLQDRELKALAYIKTTEAYKQTVANQEELRQKNLTAVRIAYLSFENAKNKQEAERLFKLKTGFTKQEIDNEQARLKAVLDNIPKEESAIINSNKNRLKTLKTQKLDIKEVDDELENVYITTQKIAEINQDFEFVTPEDLANADALNEKWEKIRRTKELAYSTAIDLSSSLLEISNNLTQTEIDNQEMIRDSKIKSLDDQLERGTINEKKYQSEKTKAEKKADQEIASLRLKQQEREKAVASFQAILKGGLATLQAFIELGPIAGALVGLSVAAEVAAIQSQPLPKFEKGGLIQGKSHRHGGVIIEAEGNEFIVNKLQTPKHMDVLEHINKGSFEEYNKRRYIIPALKKERENIRQSIINSFNDANLLSSDQKNREILREIRDALKEGRPYTNKRKI